MHTALAEAADEGARVVTESWPHNRGTELERMEALLARLGYEPRADGDVVQVRNCPYQQLSSEHPDLVCPMNRDFIAAAARRLECDEILVESVEPGTRCCVRVRVAT
jgi:hypothetical protein